MLDLKKFTKEVSAAVPVVDNTFQYMRKKYTLKEECADGWYIVELNGNDAIVSAPFIPEIDIPFEEEHKKSIIKGYTYNNTIIFQNFDVGKRKAGHEISAPLYLNRVPTFSSIEAIIWEDKKLYYLKPSYNDILIHQVQAMYESDGDLLTIKRVTPELKMVYLFHNIEKQKIVEEQERLQKEKDIEEFKKTLEGRLILAFNRVGAKILKYSISGNRITVDWEMEGSSQQFNSVIEADSFRVIEAGYCMSGHDREHTVHSMVKLAESYDEDNLIYKTRQ